LIQNEKSSGEAVGFTKAAKTEKAWRCGFFAVGAVSGTVYAWLHSWSAFN
jgi:hypothetical protein